MRMILLALFVTGLVSCGELAVDDPPQTPVVSDMVARPLGAMDFEGADVYQGDSDAARKARLELLDAVMDRYAQIRSAVRRVSAGTAPAEDLVAVLDASDLLRAERWFVEQMSATLVLESMVGAPGSPGPQGFALPWEAQTASYCMEMLLRHESPNAPLQLRVLRRLKGDRPDAEISAQASAAAGHAYRWLERECGSCNLKDLPASAASGTFRIDASLVKQSAEELAQLGIGE